MRNWYFWIILGVLGLLIFAISFILVPKLSVQLIQTQCPECEVIDSIQLAMQMGRLDVVSLCLAMLGIGFGFFAIFSFLNIRDNAAREARIVAEEILRERFGEMEKEIAARVRVALSGVASSMVATEDQPRTNPQEVDVSDRIQEEGRTDD